LPAAVVATAVLSASFLGLTPEYAPGLATAVLVAGGTAAVVLALVLAGVLRIRAIGLAAGAVAVACVLAAPTAYSLSTVARSVTGSFATAGPEAAVLVAKVPGAASGSPGPSLAATAVGGLATISGPGAGGKAAPPKEPSLASYLLAHRGTAEFLVAVRGAQSAEPLILATGAPVMTMGGFSGTDPTPTLAQFKQLVAEKKVGYILVGGRGGGSSSAIAQWAAHHGTVVDADAYGGTRGGGTLYRVA